MAVVNPLSQSRVVERIEAVRTALSFVIDRNERFEHSVSIDGPAWDLPIADVVPEPVRELLQIVDGMRFIQFQIYSANDADKSGVGYAADLSEGKEKWHCIGEHDETPIFLDRESGSIWFPRYGGSSEFAYVPMEELAPDIWTFVGWYLLGPGYLDPYFGGEDNWVEFLRENSLFGWE